ncbi:sensor histidine kinase [bacterium]|nr:sensor histidine kinase [bacterium]
MDLNQFLQFINQFNQWPQSQAQWEDFGCDLAGVLSAPCVFLLDQEVRPLFASPSVKMMLDDPSLKGNLFQRLDSVRMDLQKQKYPSPYWISIKEYKDLGVSNHSISEFVLIEPMTRLGEKYKEVGTLVLSFAHAPSELQKLSLLSVSLKLNELALRTQFADDLWQRNQFLSVAIHELKTPLTAIYGILQLQLRVIKGKKKEELTVQEWDQHTHFFYVMLQQVERLRDLMNDLLSVSRIENGQFTVEPEVSNVTQLIQDCVKTRLKILAQQASVSLEEELEKEVNAFVDPMRLEEVVTNLVMNSIRFSPEGGIIHLSLKKDATHFRLFVRDQGPSILLEDRERIFQPFERAQKTSRLGGLGLGLYISRQIAQLHGGTVVLKESLLGKGNLFEATFPLESRSF